jgi:hypothetical protein
VVTSIHGLLVLLHLVSFFLVGYKAEPRKLRESYQ